MKHETWYGCYANGWQEGELVADAFSHPAKMAKGLVYRIVSEGLKRGYWTKKTTILDPFGGIGSTGLACTAFGIPSLLVELEPKFVALAEQTFDLHRKSWDMLGLPHPRIIQGDSRRLGEIVTEAIAGAVTSPPFLDSLNSKDAEFNARARPGRTEQISDYGTSPGQLGAMKEGSLGAVTSPPYAESDPSASHAQGTSRKDPKSKNYRPVAERDWQERETARPYGETSGQIGSITSPPFADSLGNTKSGIDWSKQADAAQRADPEKPHGYDGGGYGSITSPPFTDAQSGGGIQAARAGRSEYKVTTKNPLGTHYTSDEVAVSPANIARLPIGAVTSPPYEGSMVNPGNAGNAMKDRMGKNQSVTDHARDGYGDGMNNLGNQQGETYWGAVRVVYQQMYELFSPGGHAAIVVKSFVRNKKIVPLPQMTLDLLMDIGFEPVLWVDAKLTGEAIEPSMLAEVPDYQRKKASFFRRLHERKSPETAINEEVVLFVRKP